MIVKTAKFVSSHTGLNYLPEPNLPEFAFIGRSNVGKSSLINMLCNNSKLAKTSSTPGKTQTINHFIINEDWYLVDLPGYGYAKVSKHKRNYWQDFIVRYLRRRDNLINLFVLIDSRLKPQKIDLEFINWLGENGIPFSIIMTKTDKITNREVQKNLDQFTSVLQETWEELPPIFITSSKNKTGKEEVLNYIEEYMQV